MALSVLAECAIFLPNEFVNDLISMSNMPNTGNSLMCSFTHTQWHIQVHTLTHTPQPCTPQMTVQDLSIQNIWYRNRHHSVSNKIISIFTMSQCAHASVSVCLCRKLITVHRAQLTCSLSLRLSYNQLLNTVLHLPVCTSGHQQHFSPCLG